MNKQRIPGLLAFMIAAVTTFYTVKCSAFGTLGLSLGF